MQNAQHALHARLEERHWWFTGRRRILRALIARLAPPGQGHRIVDVGCGTGANLAALSGGWRCRGLDAAPEAIDLARARFPALELDCVADPLERREWLEQADVVLLADVLEHVDDDGDLLARLVAALRPGAHVLVTVPADMRLWSPHDEAFGHRRRYDPAGLRATWRDLPVSERMLSPFNARLLPLVRAARALSRRRGRAGGPAGTDFRLPPAPLNRALEGIFAGETTRLLGVLDGGAAGYRAGASLVAVLRREDAAGGPPAR